MSKNRFFAFLSTALLVAAAASFAGEEKHVVKVQIAGDGDVIQADDLEIGETRQFFTESGKEVVVTRDEDGYELTVDGREIDVVSPGGHGISVVKIDREDGEGEVDVRVKKIVRGDHGENVFFFSGDEEGHEGHEVFVWTGDEGGDDGDFSWTMGVDVKSVADQLLESGALDKLDETTRKEILAVVEKAEKRRVVRTGVKKIVIDTENEQ